MQDRGFMDKAGFSKELPLLFRSRIDMFILVHDIWTGLEDRQQREPEDGIRAHTI